MFHMTFSKKEILVFVGVAVLFLALRIPGVHLPYHQDEYKWPMIVNPSLTNAGGIPHPPVGEFIYKTAGQIIGYNNFRFVPLFFSFLNLILLFYLLKSIAGKKEIFWSVLLFAVSFYSVLASLMVDTDGAIMPFFFLLSAISYYKLRISNFQIDKTKWKWVALLAASVILGFLVKVSFLIGVSALVLDFVFEKKIFSDRKKVLKYFGVGLLSLAGLVLVLVASRFIFPFFRLEWSLKYWEHFANSSSFLGRGWLQTFIQFVKSVLFASPLLILPVFFAGRDIWKRLKPFFFFVFIGLLFYLFIFDFSLGAIDRYLQFLIVPLCVISGTVFAEIMSKEEKISKIKTAVISAVALLIFKLQFLDNYVPSLYPKTEWVNYVLSFKWNFLYPFSGGSGPLPFYVSFVFLALVWIGSIAFLLLPFVKKNFKKQAMIGILVFGLLYNAVFVEEYLFGRINGSVSRLLPGAVAFIRDNPKIKNVTVYNDNGGYELQQTGKYRKRLYTSPSFGSDEKAATLNQYKEYYLEINIPRIDPNSFYRRYLDSCGIVYKQTDRSISATVYDCRNAPDVKP
jgi:hypothetical protein